VAGDEIGSREVEFRPTAVRPGRYRFRVGGAGSAVLVLQTVLPPLLDAGEESTVDVHGGTHNPWAPPYEFLERCLIPLLNRETERLRSALLRPGFHPAGGGHLRVRVSPGSVPSPLELVSRGPVAARRARAVVSDLPVHIAEREVSTAHAFLDLRPDAMEIVEIEDPRGPGNVIMIEVVLPTHTEVFTGFGRIGVPAEEVALEACREARSYLEADAPIGPHLADQLLTPLALEGGGIYRATEITSHARSTAALIQEMTGRRIEIEESASGGTVHLLDDQ
jgi:RNA 3'-terminal phosphate cyclase (ATP)